MKKFIIITAFLTGTVWQGHSQVSLEECRRLARENYPLIRQLELVEKSRELNLSNIARSWLPQLGITGMAAVIDGIPDIVLLGTTTETDNYHFVGIANLSQALWDGGHSRSKRRITHAEAEVEKKSIEVELYKVSERVDQLFFGILLADEQLKQTDILRQLLESNLHRAEIAVMNGIAYPSDMDKIEVELLHTEQTLINLQACRKSYCQMLSLMTKTEITPQTMLVKPTQMIHTLDREINRPELHLFESQRTLNDARHFAVTSSYMPKIGLKGYAVGISPGISFGNNKLNHLLMAGISLSWNIGGLYTQYNERNKIKINNRMIDARQETFKVNTHIELSKQDNEIERFQRLIDKDKEIAQRRESIKNASEVRYEHGACTMTDLINDIHAENLARQTKAHHEIEFLMYLYQRQTTSGNQ
ncbi:MAG: TolC family protein [Tannerellaceae bacterium]|nr:TolC family protein [Tannerellaceae bacterium]